MPNSLLEAMVAGLPSVVFDIPAIQDILRFDQEALLAVKAFDYEHFFEKLALLSKDPDRRKIIGVRGKELVRRHFSVVQNMRAAMDCLKSLNGFL